MPSFEIASFNIGAAGKMFNRYDIKDLSAIADAIKTCGADIVACQEVDRGCTRSGGVDMPDYISKKAGYPYYHFIRIRPFQGGEYGTLLLSKFPIMQSATIDYKVTIAKQGTSCGYIVFELEGRLITVFNTHLSIESVEGNADTLRCLNDELNCYMKKHGDLICCGDFNTQPETVLAAVENVRAANTGLHTYADVSIDNVLYTKGFEVSDVRTAATTDGWVSDHNMLICHVNLL